MSDRLRADITATDAVMSDRLRIDITATAAVISGRLRVDITESSIQFVVPAYNSLYSFTTLLI